MKYSVTITKQDFLDNGFYSNTECPLAVALKRVFPNRLLRVGGFGFTIDNQFVDFEKCDFDTILHNETNLSELIFYYAVADRSMSREPKDLTITFELTLLRK